MRDPARIARIAAKLTTLWRVYPDMRLGQLVENVKLTYAEVDLFYLEDDKFEECLDEILSTGKF